MGKYSIPCKYEKQGRCHLGAERCCFLHPKEKDDKEGKITKGNRYNGKENTARYERKYCEYKDTEEGCRFGVRCWDSHEKVPKETKDIKKNRDRYQEKERGKNEDL